ncbi:MAG TPA: LCP family protein, partial [Jiangellaceae bacterium]|nr:LCP family protein [Jiangellaceae bacterium]
MADVDRASAPRADDRGADRPGPSPSSRGYGRFLGWAVLGSLAPGTGLIAAGHRRSGWLIFGAWLGLVAGIVVGVARAGMGGLLSLGSDPGAVRVVGAALVVVAALWLAVALVSLYLLEPSNLNGVQRFGGAVAVVAAMSLIIAPLAVGAQHTQTHTEMIDRVFSSGEQRSLTIPTPLAEAEPADPWGGHERVNVLLLGSDAADGLEGVRPDTLIVASVDTRTGDTVLLSLPRNLQRVPFPEDSPLHELYPQGFDGPGDRNNWILNAVYESVPAAHPEVFADSSYPGADATKWAVEGALNIDVDYFVMVNLEGFERIVDALGGITIDVHYRVPIGTQLNPATGRCTPARDWIEPGPDQRLSGARALWYARARCGPYPVTDDYNRMERQRCVLGAIIDEARPLTLLRHYERFADAAGDLIVTDIPQPLLPALVDLGRMVQDASVTSLAFTDEVVQSRQNPDFEQIQELTAEAMEPASDESPAPRVGQVPAESPTAGSPASGGDAAANEPSGEDDA